MIVDEHRAVGARWTAALGDDSHQQSADTCSSFGGERRATTKRVLRPSHNPAQTSLQWRDAGAQFVTVQRQPGLEAKGVACPAPGRCDTSTSHCGPQIRRRGVGHRDLDTRFTRVAGASHHAVDALPREATDPETTNGRSIGEDGRQAFLGP